MINKTTQVALGSISGFLAFGFGSGLAPKAPGTWGTLAAIPFLFLWQYFPWQAYLVMLAVTFTAGIYICQSVTNKLGVHDHGGIVWDEFVGLWLTFFMVELTWQSILIGFVLFRVFDILKPFPIKWLDSKVKGGFGIMIDDVLAGVFAAVILHILMAYIL
ncbi:phosphatidylglycerophosphatase A family protein [Marinicella rhabdoformis]|uniref:phosphatidylglycerophosphatase A family protein n=1 Tax=Marinicella rhabdoformis TaxID=2580566 RepID=UPI0012AEDA61|nr:phosphatidylglycerophosphatase A [Marinicella rhabdoformis]